MQSEAEGEEAEEEGLLVSDCNPLSLKSLKEMQSGSLFFFLILLELLPFLLVTIVVKPRN